MKQVKGMYILETISKTKLTSKNKQIKDIYAYA